MKKIEPILILRREMTIRHWKQIEYHSYPNSFIFAFVALQQQQKRRKIEWIKRRKKTNFVSFPAFRKITFGPNGWLNGGWENCFKQLKVQFFMFFFTQTKLYNSFYVLIAICVVFSSLCNTLGAVVLHPVEFLFWSHSLVSYSRQEFGAKCRKKV